MTEDQDKSTDNAMNILVVEDEKADAIFIQRAMDKSPINNNLTIVDDGEKALDYLEGSGDYADREKHPLPNLVLLDLKLPKVSGLEVLKRIKNMDIVKRIPVVILSSSYQQSDIKEAYDSGANSYFVKQVKFSNFVTMVDRITEYWLKHTQQPPYWIDRDRYNPHIAD